MRLQAEERGVISSGFERAADGWHIVKFDEGIDYLKRKDKESGEEVLSTNKSGDKAHKLVLIVEDEEDESNGVKIDVICSENKKGEQTLTNFLGATGLFAKFVKAFPGDVSAFDDKVMTKIKTNLPGQFLRVKTHQSPDRKNPDNVYVNIVGFGPMSDSIEKLEAALFPGKKETAAGKGGKKGGEDKKSEVVDDEF